MVFSHIITSLSALFLSEDLELCRATPASLEEVFLSRVACTIVDGSWMMVIFGLPVMLAYAQVSQAGPGSYAALIVINVWTAEALYFKGFSRAQETKKRRTGGGRQGRGAQLASMDYDGCGLCNGDHLEYNRGGKPDAHGSDRPQQIRVAAGQRGAFQLFDHEYIGNLHIHSSRSDGTFSAAEIAETAAGLGLDFICLNDHDFMTDGLHLEDEGFYDSVLLLSGLEIGGRYHHYLAYDLKEFVSSDGAGPQEVIDSVNRQGGFGFLAHPFEKGMPFVQKGKAYTWNDLSVKGFTGICIWNYSSRWKERVKNPVLGLFCLVFKRRSLRGASIETLAFWDRLCRRRRVVGIGGSDAHGSRFKWGRLSFYPLTYDFLLNTINVHIFLNRLMPRDFTKAKQEVYSALRAGRLFVAHDGLWPARGFRFDFVSSDGSDLLMGEEGKFQPGLLLIELPIPAHIRLIKDGILEKTWYGSETFYRVTEPGVYRVEVFLKLRFTGKHPWIYSNPIYLRA